MRKRSFFLNDHWDITLDDAGNFPTTTGRYCDAQNVANASRCFTRDDFPGVDERLAILQAGSLVFFRGNRAELLHGCSLLQR